MLLASAVLASLLASPCAAPGGGAPAPIARWTAAEGVPPHVSNLVGAWTGAGASPVLANDELRAWPRRDARLAAGHPALVFDGNDGLAAPDAMPAGSASRAIAFRVDAVDKGGFLLGGGPGDGLRVLPESGLLAYAQGGSALRSAAPVTLGEFHVAVVTYADATGAVELFLDGAPVAAGVLPPPADLGLGVGSTELGGLGVDGAVAEVRLYDVALTDAERAEVEAELDVYRDPTFPAVELAELPRDAAIAQRGPAGTAEVPVAGVVETPGYDLARLVVRRDGAVHQVHEEALVYGLEGASFAFTPRLQAGLFDHELEVELVQGARATSVALRENVCVGDVILVDGQSNAVAKDWHDEELGDLQQSHWVRSFGDARFAYASTWPLWWFGAILMVPKATHPNDSNWDLARSLVPHDHATVGQWALRMGRLLVQLEGVPVAVLNGGMEGSSILAHQRNDAQPTDPSGLYGRLLERARLAGVAESARALVYYQGEVDGEQPALWEALFGELWADWHVDYPALERVYALQIREGCAEANDDLREIQRTLGEVYPDVTVMSTTAVPTHDSCHYYHVGYLEIGERMARLLARDLHGTASLGVEPPRIVHARWESPARDALILTFETDGSTLVVDPGTAAFVSVSDGTEVTAVTALGGDRARVLLAGRSTADTVTWRGHAYDGPWIENAQGVGALTFFDLPVGP